MKASTLRSLGFFAIALAVIGSVTSISVVRTGVPDGFIYLSVNIALTITGVILLVAAARGRRDQHTGPRASVDASTKPPPATK